MKKIAKIIVMLMVISVMFLKNGYCAEYTYTWTGSFDENWNDHRNWSGGAFEKYPGEVLTDINNVVFDVDEPIPVNCLLNIDIIINDFTIINPYTGIFSMIDKILTVNGDFYVDQIATNWINQSTVVFGGSTDQTITIIDFDPQDHSFDYLTINKTSGAIILGSDIYVDIEDGFVNTSGSTIQYNGHIIYENGNPLPIELLYFKAVANINTITLYWSTASETNNDYFIIERSRDCKTWDEIKRIDGAGNSATQIDYTTTDYNPLSGISYYRLTQVDYDGKFETFDYRSVQFDGMDIQIYPNPAQEYIMIDANETDIIMIFDQIGRIVLLGISGRNDISALNKGLYTITINNTSYPFIKY